MGASHAQIAKIWCKNCFFYVKKYPIPFFLIFLLFLSYMFVPLVYKVFIYSSPLVGISFVVHRVFLGIDRRTIKKAEQDDKRKKFAKSRRSFKSNRNQLNRRNTKTKSDNINYSDTDVEDRDDIFSMSLFELLADKATLMEKNKMGEVNLGPVVRRDECSSSYDYRKYDNVKDDNKYESEGVSWDEDDEPRDKAVRWTEDDQNNKMDLGLLETERNKRLEGMIQRRRSRKNLGYQEKGATEDNKDSQVPAIKVVKINPFLEVNSCGKNTVPGSAPSSLLATRNPFDLPYDPHEEKPDLSGDNFHEEFTANHHKEAMFCRHQSFSLGAFSHPDATHDNRDMSFYKNLATKRFTLAELGTSNVDDKSGYKHYSSQEGESSKRVVGLLHEKDGTERKSKEMDVDSFDSGSSTMLDERKADIMFFYGGKKRLGHAPSNSIVSDLQVELSDEETSLKDLDIEKEKGSWLNLSNLSKVDSEVLLKSDGEEDSGIISSSSVVSSDLPSSSTQEMDNRPQSLNSDTVESNQLQESSASDGLTEVADRQAHVTSSSPKSVLERGFSTEVQQSNNHTREAENGLHL